METSHCRSCECKVFVPQLWKDSKCKECFHYLLDHSKDFQRHSTEKEGNAVASEFTSAKEEGTEGNKEVLVEKRDHIVKEILTTERTYVENLSCMTEVYLVALKGIPDNIITQAQMMPIFSNVEEILPVNKQLLKEFEKKWENWNSKQTIGDVLLTITPFLKTYTNYTAGYATGLAALRECEKNSVFQGVISKCSAQNRLGLDSLMIQPVQRIPRYNLLLADLLKNTETTHPDYKNLKTAYEKMLHVADNINEAIRISENRKKVLEIQNSFLPANVSIVAPHRMYVRQGTLSKVCRKSNKKFTFFLFSDMLLYADPLPADRFLLHRKFSLDSCRLEEQGPANIPFSFVVANSQKSFAVFADTQELKDEWISDITQQMKQLVVRRESFRGKQSLEEAALKSSAEAPVWAPDDSAPNCSICNEEFSFFTRRHHCRACGIVVCSKCSDKKLRIPTLDSKSDVRVCSTCYQKRMALRQSQDAAQDARADADDAATARDGQDAGNARDLRDSKDTNLGTPPPSPKSPPEVPPRNYPRKPSTADVSPPFNMF